MSAKQLFDHFNQNTSIPVKILVPVFAMAVWIIALLYDIRDIQRENWTVHNQDQWSEEVARLNPGFKTPSPYDIKYRGGIRNAAPPFAESPAMQGSASFISPTTIKAATP